MRMRGFDRMDWKEQWKVAFDLGKDALSASLNSSESQRLLSFAVLSSSLLLYIMIIDASFYSNHVF